MEQCDKYQEMVEREINDLWNLPQLKKFSPEEMNRLKTAYQFAFEAHKPQKRKTGEPYIIHPIAVARIVVEEFGLGVDPMIAAFLHDVVEDTPYTIDDIKKRFGEEIAFLVGIVTKKKKEHYEMSKQLDNYKQMLDSIHYDIRALLIKLADRLHNMRTLSSMRSDKQMKIAGETDYFYAPLANRLGLYDVKTELENLSMKFRCQDDFENIHTQLETYKKDNKTLLDNWTEKLKKHLENYGLQVKVRIKYRSVYSVWRKMQISDCDFKHIPNIHVVQVIFNDEGHSSEKNVCLQIYSALTDSYKEKPGSLHNYLDSPKENGYQALHVKILDKLGEWEEVQITSQRMLNNARLGCLCERASGVQLWIEKFKEVLKDIAYNGKYIGFMDNVVSNFYSDDMIIFTPKGNGIILPKNATALDFAYAIHSNIGKHAQYARVNRKLVSVKTLLKRGDCVEIGTCERIVPQEDWLNHVITYKARRNIEMYLRHMSDKQKEKNSERCPICHPLPGEEVIGFIKDNGMVTIHKRNCPDAIKLASEQGDNIVSITFNETTTLYPICIGIRAIDRYHLFIDLIHVITDELKLNISDFDITNEDEIVDCNISFGVHSIEELNTIISRINTIDGVDEVKRGILKE